MGFRIEDGVLKRYIEEEGVTEVVIPEGVTRIGDWAFRNCKELTSVTIPEGVTSIGGHAFEDRISLTSVTIPDNLTGIEGSTFEGCTSLTGVTIPDGVKSICSGAFCGCKNLTATIPDSVTEIKNNAFEMSTVFQIRDFSFHVIDSDKVSFNEQLSMIRNKDYTVQMSHEVKYPLLWDLYGSNPDDPELFAYIKKNFSKMFPVAIKENNVSAVTAVCESENLLTKRNVDKMLELAIEHTQEGGSPEIQILLMDYKSRKLGSKKDAFSSFKL